MLRNKHRISLIKEAIASGKRSEPYVNLLKMEGGGDPPKSLSKKDYYNPKKEEGITSGNKKMDFLYNNQWLFKVPIANTVISAIAKKYAEYSGAGEGIDPNVDIKTASERPSYSGGAGVEMIDQFFSKKPIFDKATYKPTSDYYEFLPTYSIKRQEFMDMNKQSKDNYINKALGKKFIDPQGGMTKEYEEFLKNKENVYLEDTVGLQEGLGTDLGSFKAGFGYDTEKDLPYLSISDAWDFYPEDYSRMWNFQDNSEEEEKMRQQLKVQSSILNKAGHPYKVYDRFYFDPETKEYIEDLLPTKEEEREMQKQNKAWEDIQKYWAKEDKKELYDLAKIKKRLNVDAISGADYIPK